MQVDILRSFSEIFSLASFRRILKNNDEVNVSQRLKKHICYSDKPNKELLNDVYDQLLKSYRSEYVYKNKLIDELLIKKQCFGNTVALNEFHIGNSIADLVLINGEATIYEIKTAFDDLTKLSKQVDDYYAFATDVYVVAHSKHLNKLLEIYDDTDVGIIELTKRNALKYHKKALPNHKKLDHLTIFKSLRKVEYISVLKSHNIEIPSVPNTLFFKSCLALVKTINIIDFQKSAMKILKNRNIKNPERLDSVPDYLKYICYSLNLSVSEYRRLDKFLKTPMLCTSPI